MADKEKDTKPNEGEEEDEEEDLEALEKEIKRMEEEAARISKEADELKNKGNHESSATAAPAASSTDKAQPAKDSCSIYVGQVDYSATPEELVKHFEACGTIERVTIVCDKFTGRPKGFAYLEFQVQSELLLFKDDSFLLTHFRFLVCCLLTRTITIRKNRLSRMQSNWTVQNSRDGN